MLEPRSIEKVQLDGLKLNRDDQGYYLSAQYTIEDRGTIKEVCFPKIRLKIGEDRLHIEYTYNSCRVDMGCGSWLVEPNIIGVYYTEKVIGEKIYEMTLSEIEKKLGYKVKIVSE